MAPLTLEQFASLGITIKTPETLEPATAFNVEEMPSIDTPELQDNRPLVSRSARRWTTFSPRELKNDSAQTPLDLIAGFIPSRAVVTFAGAPGLGKSFTALSWCASLASGTPWFGQEVNGPQPAVYVLGEGWARFGRRVEAWEAANDVDLPDSLRFINGAREGIDLTDREHVDQAIETFLSMTPVPALIVFDTFAMLAEVKSENDNAEVKTVFANAHKIVAETGATVVIVHHTGKDGLIRGATAFRGNADTVVVAGRDKNDSDDSFFLSTMPSDDGKQRDGEAIKFHGFKVAPPGVLTHLNDGNDADATVESDPSASLKFMMQKVKRPDLSEDPR